MHIPIRAGCRMALGFSLAVLTMGLAARQLYDLPVLPHPIVGEVHEPGKPFRQGIEGRGSGIWTSNGVRRASYPTSGGHAPVLILGDSYTEAIQVDDEDYFGHLLEGRLGGTPVLAVGRSGYSVTDYIAKAESFKRLFKPGWVVIEVGAGDFQADAWTKKAGGYAYFERDSSRGSSTEVSAGASARGTQAVERLRVVSLPCERPGWLSTAVREHCPFWFPLLSFSYLRKSEWQEWLQGHEQPWFHATAAPLAEAEAPGEDLRDYPLDEEMELLAAAYEGRLTLLYLPRFDPDRPGAETRMEQELHRLAAKHQLGFVSIGREFAAIAAAGHSPYGFGNTRFNWGHWNPLGNRAAAELLAKELRTRAQPEQGEP